LATCSAIGSLLKQTITGIDLTIVLVNNQSSQASLEIVNNYLNTHIEAFRKGHIVTKIIDYNHPFNHSQQSNLGIRQFDADVYLLMNNDAQFLDKDGLATMVGYSRLRNVATVGCKVVGKDGSIVCAGIKVRKNLGHEFNSPVEESRDRVFAESIRETCANPFACTVITKEAISRIGGLNGVEFPNGYNDVEFCLRARQVGLRNLYIGSVSVTHEPGTSRGRCDEVLQKILIRERFPDLLRDSLFQFEEDAYMADSLYKFKSVNTNRKANLVGQ